VTSSSGKPGRLILLVGSNPLPNYLSALALGPAEIALVYTRETEIAKDLLKSELRRALGDTFNFVDAFVQDATCATTVRRTIDSLLAEGNQEISVWLNYTGGTKVMAAHTRMACAESGGKSARSTYLDEGGKDVAPRLRYDDGCSRKLAELRDPVHREDDTGLIVRPEKRHHGWRAIREGFLEDGEFRQSLRGHGNAERAISPGLIVGAGLFGGAVFHGGGDQRGIASQIAQRTVQRGGRSLRPAAGEKDLGRAATDARCDLFTGGFDGLASALAGGVQRGRVGVFVDEKGLHGRECIGMQAGGGVVVQIDHGKTGSPA